MTLTTHGIIGAATASLFPSFYPLAWFAAFLSHFFADAVPHWDYQTRSYRKSSDPLKNDFVINKDSLVDLIKIGTDFSLGILLGYLFFSGLAENPWLILGGAFFGILPDPLQFAYWKIRREPLTSLQKLHLKIHAKKKIKSWRIGIPIQIAIVILTVLITTQLHEILKMVSTFS